MFYSVLCGSGPYRSSSLSLADVEGWAGDDASEGELGKSTS